ncbi:MAG: methyltransferase domain-containing protein [Ketobacter sp.]|nr:methyltransferase domain-containing protein [Planctomycetota bacterium]MCP5015647.1 methyltransferase domain-containing protein [Ketobacter sp.]
MNNVTAVLECYSESAATATGLCCPVNYDPKLLAILPQEIIDKDYGCGDPSRYIRPGDTVLDLGSGGGKICYIAAQLVGPSGRVIGVDMNDDMLALARKYQSEMAEKIGADNVLFYKGHIQDLALDLERSERDLQSTPVKSIADLQRLKARQEQQRNDHPLIPSNSVDVVISNCVLNLVTETDRQQMIQEIFRVLKPGGRVAISDIVSDEVVPKHLKEDSKLWTECVTGAFQELEFLNVFKAAGFLAVGYSEWDPSAWRTIEDIEFRSVTLTATKAAPSECMDYGHAVIYRGPFSEVIDDEGHIFPRGERMAVCERTYSFLTTGPLKESFIGLPPLSKQSGVPWCAPVGTRRSAAETKGSVHDSACSGVGCC